MLLKRKRVLAAKIETTVGQAIALAAGDAAFNVFNAVIEPTIEMQTRDGQSAFSPLPSVAGGRLGRATFSIELTGGGSTPSWASTFLPACGLKETTGTFAPLSEGPGTNIKTLTIGLFENGLYKQLRGAMGNAVFRFVAGQIVMIDFTFSGIFDTPTDVAILTPTYPTLAPLRFVSSDLDIGSWAPKVRELTIDLGNEVVMREDSSDASGYVSAVITGRRVNGTMDPESDLVATEASFTKWLAGTERAMDIDLGASGNAVAIDIPKFQLTNMQPGDRGMIQTDTVSWQANRSASAGDDEITIAM